MGRTLATAALAALGAVDAAHADIDDRALLPFARPAAAAPRAAPVDSLEWEHRLRAPDRFGPPWLRPSDATFLAAARAQRWPEALRLLKAGQASPNARDEALGNALVLSARAGQEELVRELIKRGADIDRVGEDGFTALGGAAFAGHRSVVRLLVLAGADVERLGASGQTALHLAGLAGQLDVVDELLRLKVPLELLNRLHETALDVAAAAGQQEVMSRLIEAGADLTQAGRR
jgi:ankyrin repeat protein